MQHYKIKSVILRARGVRIESVDKRRMERRLDDVKKIDPDAKIVKVTSR